MDQLSTSRVDNHHAWLHLRNALGVDKERGFGRKRTMQRDNIALGVQLVQRNHPHIIPLGKIHIGVKVVCQHLHPKAMQYLYQFFCNPAHAHNACRLAVHVETHQAFKGKITLACAVNGTENLTIKGQHQRNGILGNGMRRVSRHANNLYPTLCSMQVYVVKARTTQRNKFHTILNQLVDNGCIAFRINENAHHIGTLGQWNGFKIEMFLIITDVKAIVGVRLVERDLVVRFGIEECYFNHEVVDF